MNPIHCHARPAICDDISISAQLSHTADVCKKQHPRPNEKNRSFSVSIDHSLLANAIILLCVDAVSCRCVVAALLQCLQVLVSTHSKHHEIFMMIIQIPHIVYKLLSKKANNSLPYQHHYTNVSQRIPLLGMTV